MDKVDFDWIANDLAEAEMEARDKYIDSLFEEYSDLLENDGLFTTEVRVSGRNDHGEADWQLLIEEDDEYHELMTKVAKNTDDRESVGMLAYHISRFRSDWILDIATKETDYQNKSL